MATILDNTVLINLGNGWTFLTDIEYQAIEGYSYTSLDGPGYGCTSSDGVWQLQGSLPPGLSLDAGTGVISGTVTNFLSSILVDAIVALPNSTQTDADQGSYTLGSLQYLTKKFSFTVLGLNNSQLNPPTTVACEITVLKNFSVDVQDWQNDFDKYNKGKKDKVYY